MNKTKILFSKNPGSFSRGWAPSEYKSGEASKGASMNLVGRVANLAIAGGVAGLFN